MNVADAGFGRRNFAVVAHGVGLFFGCPIIESSMAPNSWPSRRSHAATTRNSYGGPALFTGGISSDAR